LLVDARSGLLDAKEEIERLSARIAELEAARVTREHLTLRNGVYYHVESGVETGPFCVRCFESDQS
jgi:hypothetical protein